MGLVLTETNPGLSSYLAAYLRAHAARENVILAVTTSRAGSQGEDIRKLADESVSAMIVIPDSKNPPAEALKEARDLGVPVVLMGESVRVDPPVHCVRLESLEGPAETIVREVSEAASKAGAAADSPALILVSKAMGQAGQNRALAFRKAVESTSHRLLPDSFYADRSSVEAASAVREVLQDHENLAMVLAIEEQGLLGLAQVYDEQKEAKTRPIAIGGFHDSADVVSNPLNPAFTAVGDLDARDLAGRALDTALRLADGDEVASEELIKIPIRHPSESSFPRGSVKPLSADRVSKE